MGMISTEQTTEILDSVTELIEASQPETLPPEPQSWLIPLVVTIAGGIITTLFGVWYAKRRKKP